MNVITAKDFKTAQRAYDISEAERDLRVQVAAAFRVAHHYGWNLQILNHITARIPGQPDRFLVKRNRPRRLGGRHQSCPQFQIRSRDPGTRFRQQFFQPG